jgi:proteasome lid subunit RPN8/RPN11
MTLISCTSDTLHRTIAILRAGGERREERVVLWLAQRSALRLPAPIVEVYEPEQITAVDFFKLPAESLRALMTHLSEKRLRIAAQVHSHPGEAYHSRADDEWAIVRHVGALSLVLPRFAATITPENFLDQAVTYELSAENRWFQVPNTGPDGRIGVK